ncbi:uncharacterized protein LOC117115573 [Anneissia japonica]|uniref:uncharacterized protein LOC117115573 n=1 Tax=Anneissia japonica TaxID=1529436 RepID=UPI001425720D|nr:uncharacterized protein LOC117115573 [Anneissia japonica]
MAFFGERDKMHNIVYILIVLISCTSADVAFVTKPPEEVRTFPGQQVTLPCVLENLPENQRVRWFQVENIQFIFISNNRDVFTDTIENVAENVSITGNGMNFTLLFNIPDKINFGSDHNVNKLYECSVVKSDGYSTDISAKSKVIIERNLNPICGKLKTFHYVIGETLTLACFHDSDPTIITTLKSGNGKVLPTKLNGSYIIHNLKVTKNDHGAKFKFESRRNGTNEIKSCSIGPITVNYKPEINITQTSATEFNCIAEARPPVNEIQWIVESSIPQDSFMISNNVLKFIEPLQVDSEIKITCEVENIIGKGTKTLSIPTVNNREEKDGSGNIPTVNSRDEEDGSSIIPVVNNRNEEDGSDSTLVIIVVSCVVVAFLIILLFLIRKRIKHQQTSKSRNTSARFRRADPQVELKNEDPKGLVYDYAAIDVNEFRAGYQETENEIYVGGDMLNSDEANVASKKQSNTKFKDLDQIRAQPNKDCEELKNEQQVYSQVNKPDYKECVNEIYQGLNN